MAHGEHERLAGDANAGRAHADRLVRTGDRPGGEVLEPPRRRRPAGGRLQLRPRARFVRVEEMNLLRLLLVAALLAVAPARAQTPASAEEIAFWETVRDSKNPAELQAY